MYRGGERFGNCVVACEKLMVFAVEQRLESVVGESGLVGEVSALRKCLTRLLLLIARGLLALVLVLLAAGLLDRGSVLDALVVRLELEDCVGRALEVVLPGFTVTESVSVMGGGAGTSNR